MSRANILSLSENFKINKEQQLVIRLHDHGLLRLIPLSVEEGLLKVTNKIFFHSLIHSSAYKEMFFDHFSQKSEDKHGPFLLDSIEEDSFMKISNETLRDTVIQVVSSPKWSCPPITKAKLSEVKKLMDFLVNEESESYFLEKCFTFNSSSQEAMVYEHEWSHSLTSYYEYVVKDKINNKVFLLILTYE